MVERAQTDSTPPPGWQTGISLDVLKVVAADLKAVAHPMRLKMLEVLEAGEVTVSHLQTALGIGQSITSQHLQILRRYEIVVDRREGNQVFYSLKNLHMLELLDCIRRNRI